MNKLSSLLDLYFIDRTEFHHLLGSKNRDYGDGHFQVDLNSSGMEESLFLFLENIVDGKPTIATIEQRIASDEDVFEQSQDRLESLGQYIANKYKDRLETPSERNILSLVREVNTHIRKEHETVFSQIPSLRKHIK